MRKREAAKSLIKRSGGSYEIKIVFDGEEITTYCEEASTGIDGMIDDCRKALKAFMVYENLIAASDSVAAFCKKEDASLEKASGTALIETFGEFQRCPLTITRKKGE